MPVLRKVDACDWEWSHDLLDDGLIIDIIKDDLPIKTHGTHEEFVQRTETDSSDVSAVLVELRHQLLRVDIMQTDRAIVRHRA